MTPARYKRIMGVLQNRQPDLTVVADEVHKGRNLAAMVRTCDAVGVDTLYSVQPKAGYWPFKGTTLGSHKWVEVKLCKNLHEPLRQLKSEGYQLVSTALSSKAIDYREIDYTKPTALVLGSEDAGVSSEALDASDHLITIPMMGMVESFNVSVACAVILLEAQRQRLKKGMYGQRRLPDSTHARRFFEWAHPEIANYCKQKGLDYPPVREEDGEIVEPALWYKQARQLSSND